jgi:ribosomal protein S18 acetylase RimI-like enzyme
VPDLQTRPLNTTTWPDFARVMEEHNGVWGGCWCIAFHPAVRPRAEADSAYNRSDKETLVRGGRAHAALVYDGPDVVGWAQFGSVDELPRIKHRRAYDAGAGTPPDWRITCFFVARTHRGRGVASAALAGALREIGRLGGGTVESYPEDVEGRKTSSSFLYNATVSLFERHGFERTRRIGKHHWVVATVVG